MTPHTALEKSKSIIPGILIWTQCIIFVALYSVWAMREVMFFRRAALIVGALMALNPIYHYRFYFFKRRAIPVWLLVGLFIWMTCHLYFFAQDYPEQLLEFHRIWKYAALAAIFALGLGLSLASENQDRRYWPIIYLGLCSPLLIYLFKYVLTMYGGFMGIAPPEYLKMYSVPSAYYIPKTDYVAFCLPTLAISLGQIYNLLQRDERPLFRRCLSITLYVLVIAGTMFLFYAQNTKNGIAYSVLCIMLLFSMILFKGSLKKHFWKKILFFALVLVAISAVLQPHIQKNDAWRTLLSDTQIGFQLDKYPQWRYGGARGYPVNEFGGEVSHTTYERAAWLKAGLQLSAEAPLGYGLVEDSFKFMAHAKWPDVEELSHSHSGWLDLLLGVGVPGFFCIITSLTLVLWQNRSTQYCWNPFIFWASISNLMLWVTTEVSATITFCLLIFWISLVCGLSMAYSDQDKKILQADL